MIATVSTFDSIASEIGEIANSLDRQLLYIQQKLPQMSADALMQALRFAEQGHRKLFLLRGAITVEFERRAERHPAGRGKTDDEQVGVVAVRKRLAAEIGVHPKTLEQDASIVKHFFSDPKVESDLTTSEPPLPREFYKIADAQGEYRQSALAMANEKSLAEPHYNHDDFAADCAALYQGEIPPHPEQQQYQSAVTWLRVPLSQNAQNNLDTYARSHNVTWQEAANTIFEGLESGR